MTNKVKKTWNLYRTLEDAEMRWFQLEKTTSSEVEAEEWDETWSHRAYELGSSGDIHAGRFSPPTC
jgi:hypothetical protein